MSEDELPPLNSRWYLSGHHWRVVRHTTRDGEPAVRMQCLTKGRRKVHFTWIWRLIAPRALVSNAA